MRRGNTYHFIKSVETVCLPTCPLKSLIPQAPRLMARLGTHTCIDENPAIRGHDLYFDKTCQENRLTTCAVLVEENGSNNDRAVV